MVDTSHLVALQERLSRERVRLVEAPTEKEREFRRVHVAQCEREVEGELKFLGMAVEPPPDLTDDELFAALTSP